MAASGMIVAKQWQRRIAAKKEINTMKKLTALTSALLLTVGIALAGTPSEADQKWLEIVQKKVAEGQAKVSTPSETRVTLLKEWASTKGYSVEVTKTDKSFQLEVSRAYAQK
jgi:hypothetical protein